MLWVETEKGKKHPLDPHLVTEGVRFSVDEAGVMHQATDGATGRESHFSSCPNANEWRASRPTAAA